MRLAVAAALCCLLVLAFLQGRGENDDVLSRNSNATLIRVVDGDTLIAEVGGIEETVRLIGFDTPETVDPTTEIECFGPEASDRLKELLPDGSQLQLVKDKEDRDRYGRLLAYVYRSSDSLFVNEEMLLGGYAEVLSIEPNTSFKARFRDSQSNAKAAGAGLWSAC